MVTVHEVEPAGKPSCVGRKGTHACDVHRCGFLSVSCLSFLGLDGSGWQEFVEPLDTIAKNSAYSLLVSAGA